METYRVLSGASHTLLQKKGLLGFYIWSMGFFTQLQRTFFRNQRVPI